MQTSGQILKNARLNSKLTLTQLSALTKISKSTLKALEKNQFNSLPGPTYIKGFIQNYAKIVKLDSSPIVAVFRRDYKQHLTKKILPSGVTKPLNSSLNLTHRLRNLISIGIIILLFLTYVSLTIFKLYQPPKLIITQPENTIESTSPVLIKGKTSHDATLTLNGKTINLESDGSFTTVFNGPIGTHELKLKSTSRRNKSTDKSIYIIIIQ